jgi:cytochrome c-type biogenesis protein CcmH/NrfF
MRILTMLCTAVVLAAIASTPASAITSQEQAQLQRLSPELRQKVADRLGPGQTVNEILDTMVLNNISELFSEPRSFTVDHVAHTVTILYVNGETETVRYDPVTLLIVR